MVPVPKKPIPPPWPEQAAPSETTRGRQRPVPRPLNPFVVLPFLGLLVLGAGMGFIAQRVHVMALGYELRALQQELVRVQEEHRRLQVEVVRARSPERVEALARERLAMVDPGQPAVVVLTTGTAVVGTGDPGPAPVGPGSLQARMAAVGEWLWDRLTVAAEAGARQP